MGRVAVAMSGGGAKGSFELGAIDYLIRHEKVYPDAFIGVSTGNLNAAMLAQGRGEFGLRGQLDRLTNLWFDIEDNDDIYTTRFEGLTGMAVGAIARADSIHHNKPLWKLIKKHVKPEALKSSGRLLRVGVVGLMSGEYFSVDGSHPDILEMIRASASIPVYFWPIDLLNDRFVDGGVRDITPLSGAFEALVELAEDDDQDAVDRSPDTIYVILASPLDSKKLTDKDALDSGIKIGERSLSLLMNEVYRNDLQGALMVNETLTYYQRLLDQYGDPPEGFPQAKYRCVNLVVIEPDILHLDSLEFDPDKIREAFQAGRERARIAVDEARNTGTNVTMERFARKVTVLRGD